MSDLMIRDHNEVALFEANRPVQAHTREENDLIHLWRIILKRKWLVLTTLGVVVSAVGFYTYTVTPIYRSTVSIQIDREENILPYQQMYEGIAGNPFYLETQVEVLKSRRLWRRVSGKLKDSLTSGQLNNLTQRDLEIMPVPGTSVIRISYYSEHPQTAAALVNCLSEEYMNSNFEEKYQATMRAREFLKAELEALKQKVEESEAELVRYARDNNLTLFADKDNVIIQKLSDLTREMTVVEAQLLANRYQEIKNAALGDLPDSSKTPSVKALEGQLLTLQQRLATLSSQYGPNWPEVKLCQEEIMKVEKQLLEETRRAIHLAKREYDLAQAHRQRLDRALQEQNQYVTKLNEGLIQYRTLHREVQTDQELYEGLLQRLKEAGVIAGMRSSNIRVLDRGDVPSRPYSPNKALNLALALAIGSVAGTMLALFRYYTDRTLRNAEDLESNGLPCLGTIPLMGAGWEVDGSKILNGRELEASESHLTAYLDSVSLVSWESFRSLRTSLVLSSGTAPPKILVIASAMPQEGKTTIAINLAVVLAQTGERTLLVELDMRKPRITPEFLHHSARGKGMSIYLSGNGDLSAQIEPTPVPNLFVIGCGPIPPSPPELIGSPRMKIALKLFAMYFDHVIIDTPPLLSVTDALLLVRQVDGLVLVVNPLITSEDELRRSLNMLTRANAKITGGVINGVRVQDISYYNTYYQSGGFLEPVDKEESNRLPAR